MPTLTLKIIGQTDVHGRKPGDEFEIETDSDGVALDMLWRKRLSDEEKFKVGAVSVVSGSPPASKPTPAPAPLPTKKDS